MASKNYDLKVSMQVDKKQTEKNVIKASQDISKALEASGKLKIPMSLSKEDIAKVSADVQKTMNSATSKVTKMLKTSYNINRDLSNKNQQLVVDYVAQYETAAGKIETVKKRLNLSDEKYSRVVSKNVKEQIIDVGEYIKKLEDVQRQSKTTNEVVSKFGKGKHHTDAKKLTDEMKKLAIAEDMTESQMKGVIVQAKHLQKELNEVSRSARSTGKASLTFTEQLKTAFKSFSVWSAVTVIWYKSIQAIEAGIKAVIELDDALVELAKVTDLSASGLDEIANAAFEVAGGIGAIGTEVINATADFARMGFEAKDALNLAETAIVLKNVGDGIDTVDDATKTIISTLKGFKLEASESTRIIDAMNEVANNFATDSGDIAISLQRMSATMAQSNTTYEETLALFTASQEVMQNATKSSTGLITISQRLRGLSEAAEDGEDFVNFTAKLQDAFSRIADVNIMEDGKLRSTYDIMIDMADAQSRLTAEQNQYLGELAAGRQNYLYVQKCA